MSTTYTKGDLVYWFVGQNRVSGKIVDIYSRTNTMASKNSSENGDAASVLLVQLNDERKVLKLDTDVKLEKRGFV